MKRRNIFMEGISVLGVMLVLISVLVCNTWAGIVVQEDETGQWRLEEYIFTHFDANNREGTAGKEIPYKGKDADNRWKNFEKEGFPFRDDLKPAYNKYHNELTAYNAVKVDPNSEKSLFHDDDNDGVPNAIEEYQKDVFAVTGVHCDILNYNRSIPMENYIFENHSNIQIVNNIRYGNSLFTVFLPPNWTKGGSYPVFLRGHGYGSDNNTMYLTGNIQSARFVGESVLNGGQGLIVVKSNCGGRESVGINSDAIQDVGSFMENVMSNYGADLSRVITRGASRGGNTALIWGANPDWYDYNTLAIHAFVPPIKFGSMATLSFATFPAIGGCANKILGSENAYSYSYAEDQGGKKLSVEEKAFAGCRIILLGDIIDDNWEDIWEEEANNRSAYGIFNRADLETSLSQKRILISQGTHDPFMPMPYFLDFDNLLKEKGIKHRTVFGYCFGHGFYDNTGDADDTVWDLYMGNPIRAFEENERRFFMPEKLYYVGDREGTSRVGFVEITDDGLINPLRNQHGYENFFSPEHDKTKLAFSANIPYHVGQGLPVTIALIGEEGKSWKVWCRKEEGYRPVYYKSGIFGQSINHPHEREYGKEYVILNLNADVDPNWYEWFFEYDGTEIPNKFTTFVNPNTPDFPDGVPAKALTKVIPQEPLLNKYYFPGKKGPVCFGVVQYHPFLLEIIKEGNIFPALDPIGNISVTAGERIQLTINATDRDGDEVVYDLRDKMGKILKIDGLGFNGLNGKLIWQTTQDDIGLYTLIAIAKDGRGGVATQEFSIEIH